jgi:predicted N-acetyltransferase YhbS
VADINGVRVLPEFRRRGFGTALTWATVAEAARLGCHAAVLTSTEMGYAVYVRMGFHPVCTLRTYVPPPLTPSTTIRRHARRAYHVQTGLAGRRHHSRRVVWGVPVVGAPRVLDGSARLN